MEHQVGETGGEDIEPPAVIVLGDAATLTRGSDQSGSESKRTPYD
ncbi:albusnodin family lasso peptide [Streptomyces iconiensis]|uniref:Albusnodin family lasso peptide n=1 Tax=Streptomyces iconiensis TaxID=1384038 RepID=A0ABT6ZWV1_9ACTN|nr:albusnodin family lasso peptide [Streptomyces iconiensis]MDJ1133548.1 albusnodin family lasso peptide [Streptomyces iconiensis]